MLFPTELLRMRLVMTSTAQTNQIAVHKHKLWILIRMLNVMHCCRRCNSSVALTMLADISVSP